MPFYVYAFSSDGRLTLETTSEPLKDARVVDPTPVLVAVVGTRTMAELVALETELSWPRVRDTG